MKELKKRIVKLMKRKEEREQIKKWEGWLDTVIKYFDSSENQKSIRLFLLINEYRKHINLDEFSNKKEYTAYLENLKNQLEKGEWRKELEDELKSLHEQIRDSLAKMLFQTKRNYELKNKGKNEEMSVEE